MDNNLYQIVSKFPEVLEYRESLESFSCCIDQYLMLIGGTVTMRDACIDYISSLPFSKVDKLKCSSLDKNILEKQFIEDKTTDSVIKNRKKKIYDSKLFVLKDIFYFDKNILNNFLKSINKSNFLVVTIDSKTELLKLPLIFQKKFKMVDISTGSRKKDKVDRENFPSRNKVDSLLQEFIRKYPEKSRPFIVEKAFPLLEKRFAGKSMYNKSTLMTRISILRNQSNEETNWSRNVAV